MSGSTADLYALRKRLNASSIVPLKSAYYECWQQCLSAGEFGKNVAKLLVNTTQTSNGAVPTFTTVVSFGTYVGRANGYTKKQSEDQAWINLDLQVRGSKSTVAEFVQQDSAQLREQIAQLTQQLSLQEALESRDSQVLEWYKHISLLIIARSECKLFVKLCKRINGSQSAQVISTELISVISRLRAGFKSDKSATYDTTVSRVRQLVDVLEGLTISNAEYSKLLQAIRNRLMHALNGNTTEVKDPVRVIPKKAKSKSKPKKEMKSEEEKLAAKLLKEYKKKQTVTKRDSVMAALMPTTGGVQTVLRQADYKLKKSTQALVNSIVLPLNFNPVRIGGDFEDVPTAVANPFIVLSVPWLNSVSNPTNQTVPASTHVSFFFRQPERMMVLWNPNVALAHYGYQAFFTQGGSSFAAQAPKVTLSILAQSLLGKEFNFPIAFWKTTMTTFEPHSDTIFSGVRAKGDPRRFVWLEPGTVVDLNITVGGTSGTNLLFCSYLWQQDGESPAVNSTPFTVSGSPQDVSITISAPGYYCFTIQCSFDDGVADPTINSLVFTNTLGGGVFSHYPAPGYSAFAANTNNIAVNAVAFCYTNDSDTLYQGGKCVTAQLNAGVSWLSCIAGDDPFGNISAIRGCATDTVKDGAYAFIKPVNAADFTARNDTKVVAGQVFDSHYELQPPGGSLAYCVVVPDSSPQAAHLTLSCGLVYETQSTWFNTKYPSIGLKEVLSAADALKKVPQFHKNPTHISDIVNTVASAIGDAAHAVTKYEPMIKGITEVLGGLF